MNGTTNFMLSKMESEGADYGDVLKEAQELGFAEGEGCFSQRRSLKRSPAMIMYICSRLVLRVWSRVGCGAQVRRDKTPLKPSVFLLHALRFNAFV